MLNRLTRALVDHAFWVLGVFAVLTVVFGWQARKFEVDASAETLLTKDNRYYIQTRLVDQQFAADEFILLAYEPRDGDLFGEQTLADLQTISTSLRELERAKSVRSILNVPLLAAQAGSLSPNADFASMTLEQGDYSTEDLQEIFSDHPLYEDLLVNADQTATAIQVSFRADPELTELNNQITDIQSHLLEGELTSGQEDELERLKEQAEPLQKALTEQRNEEIASIRELAAEYEDRANIYLGGAHVLGFQLIQIIRQDLLVFGSAISLMICLVLFLVFRRARWVVIPAICCASSVLITLGLLAMGGLKATVISANFIALQLILTLAIVVHLIVQYRELSRDGSGKSVRSLVASTLEAKVAPCFYAGVTTSVGFSSLLLSGLQPVIAFGYMMILAMSVSIVVSLIMFPALMAVFQQEREPARHKISLRTLGFFERLDLQHPRLVGVGTVVLLSIITLGVLRLSVENSFLNYFADSTDVHRELSFIDREFGGSTPLDLVYQYPDEGSSDLVLTAETVQVMQRAQQALQSRESVGKVLSLVNFTEVARAMNGDQPLTEYELSSLYYLMEDSLRESLLGSFVQPEARQVRMSARIQDTTEGLKRTELMTDLRAELEAIFPSDGSFTLTNLFVLYQDAVQKLFKSQILTLGLVFAVLLVAFGVIFRSVSIALIALAPNILSTLAILGVMGWTGIPLDLMTMTIAAIAMGIAVDDTIHYTHRYLAEIRRKSSAEALRSTHGSIGYAVLYTSLIIALGFSLLSFSDFVPSVYFGLLTALAMVLALVTNLSLLPVLLRRFVAGEIRDPEDSGNSGQNHDG